MAPKYLIVKHDKREVWNLLKLILLSKERKSGMSFLESSDDQINLKAAVDGFWVLVLSFIAKIFLRLIETPMKYVGKVVDFFLNFVSQNGGFFGILYNILRGKLVIPKEGTDDFLSSIGQLDGRIDLYKNVNLAEQADQKVVADAKADSILGNKYLMDLCIMASKLAYENAKVVENVVTRHWQMNFVGFYNCWNESQKESNTQVFIFCDKPKDANLIVISFRGTEPFNAQDWMSDVDFSWYELDKVGKIHIGFLEAMGLGNRGEVKTFANHLQRKEKSFFYLDSESEKTMIKMTNNSAYYIVATKLCSLLKDHRNAKFVVTGHSLGGALAILFPTVLVIQDEIEILQRLLNIYTFGQPRIGDKQLGTFMESHLNYPVPKYFRVVYSNDIVPRVPFDDKFFYYKHFGVCIYYDSRYFGQFMDEEPNPNFFDGKYWIPMRMNAEWELLRSFIIGYIYGPEYRESWVSTLFRIQGLVFPGIASHSPVDYVNSVRLGKERLLHSSSLKTFALKQYGEG